MKRKRKRKNLCLSGEDVLYCVGSFIFRDLHVNEGFVSIE